MAKWRIYNEDVREWAKSYSRKKFHAMLCDPPYHLTSITKRFGRKNSAEVKVNEFFDENGNSKGSSPYKSISSGFMSQTWDGGDISFDPETWKALGEHLYPGAFGMAFSASRNWHRLAVAIEDAGFVIHPTIFLWAYGSGFPKGTRVKRQDAFDGHRYGLQALKPAVEPIIVFQKPYEGRPIENITRTGAGVLNIDGGRIGTSGSETHSAKAWGGKIYSKYGSKETVIHDCGRWPANILLDETAAQKLDAQTGIQKGGFVRNRTNGARPFNNNGKDTGYHTDEKIDEPDGGASRFFYTVSSKLDETDPVYYCAKSSHKERDEGLDSFNAKDFAQSGGAQSKHKQGEDEYLQDSIGLNRITKRKNPHPTCKPIDLARYLATLLLPPEEFAPRRILVPFSGSGSEMIGAGLAGWDQIVGVEFDIENNYVEIANARLEHWLKL